MYKVIFARQAEKSLKKTPKEFQSRIKVAAVRLGKNPFCFGTVKLIGYPAAQYRHRVGDYRILFNIWDEEKILVIADIKRRTSTTY